MTKYQSAPKGFTGTVKHGRFIYDCTSDGEGSVIINFKYKGQVLFVTKNDLKKYDTKYQKYMKECYLDMVPENDDGDNYKSFMDFFFFFTAPFAYEVEDEMLEYAKKHPKADFAELYHYFTVIVPPGTLPPDSDEWDDEEDDD